MPKYHGRAQIEIIGERLDTGTIVPPRRRPKPNSPVFALDAKETAEVLGIGGNMQIGLADGFDDLVVRIPGDSKSVFPGTSEFWEPRAAANPRPSPGSWQRPSRPAFPLSLSTPKESTARSMSQPKTNRCSKPSSGEALNPPVLRTLEILHLVGRETANPADIQRYRRSPFGLATCRLMPSRRSSTFPRAGKLFLQGIRCRQACDGTYKDMAEDRCREEAAV